MSGNEELELRARETELDKREKQLRKDIDAFNQEKKVYLKDQKEFEDFVKPPLAKARSFLTKAFY
ncbi:hypothetical protein HpCOL12_14600 [Helicobacter pylori]